jgi:hypothetical protein
VCIKLVTWNKYILWCTVRKTSNLYGYLIPGSLAVSEKRIFASLTKKSPTLGVENDHSCVFKSRPMPHILKHTNAVPLRNKCLNIIRLFTISLNKPCYEFSHLTHTCYEFCLLNLSSFVYFRLIKLHTTILFAVAFHAYITWQVVMTVGHESQIFENKSVEYKFMIYTVYRTYDCWDLIWSEYWKIDKL